MNIDRFMVPAGGRDFDLRRVSTSETDGIRDRQEADQLLAKGVERLSQLQDVLWAHDRYGILLIFQAMDAAGKDSTIKHVMSGVNPQGCDVNSFKNPSTEELDHDFMWRVMQHMPERGRIGIFNRSYYEEVLVVKVHPEFLQQEKLPPECMKRIWKNRYEDINNLEQYLVNNGILPIKFYLHVSKEEQLKRFLKRLEDPSKNWKFSENDVRERQLWDKYMEAYQEMLSRTSTEHAPWYVVPADRKWYMRAVVNEIIVSRLEQLDLHYPELDDAQKEKLQRIRDALLKQG